MASPMVPSPVMHSDIPGGGQLAIITVANIAPTTSQNQQSVGSFWLVPEPAGSGNLYFLAGFSSGVPQWELISTGSGSIVSVAGTANQITASTSTGAVTLSIPAAFTAPGSITATTSLTATLGNITATNGNIVRGTAGNKDVYSNVASTNAAGANSAGTVALVGGTIVVSTTSVTANSLIRLTCQALGTVVVPSGLCVSAKSAGVSFTILASQVTDTSTIFWEIVN